MLSKVFVLSAWAEISQNSVSIDDGPFVFNCLFFQQHPGGLSRSVDFVLCFLFLLFGHFLGGVGFL